jgi:hypothetical protein
MAVLQSFLAGFDLSVLVINSPLPGKPFEITSYTAGREIKVSEPLSWRFVHSDNCCSFAVTGEKRLARFYRLAQLSGSK